MLYYEVSLMAMITMSADNEDDNIQIHSSYHRLIVVSVPAYLTMSDNTKILRMCVLRYLAYLLRQFTSQRFPGKTIPER